MLYIIKLNQLLAILLTTVKRTKNFV